MEDLSYPTPEDYQELEDYIMGEAEEEFEDPIIMLGPNVHYMDVSINNYTSDPCKNCPNHPSNGGSGICHCILGNLVTC